MGEPGTDAAAFDHDPTAGSPPACPTGSGRLRALLSPAPIRPGVERRQPGYLRIGCGPGYLRTDSPRPPRDCGPGLHRPSAPRGYALRIEALDRLVTGRPRSRGRGTVFAVPSLESEALAPRR
ncbi:MAG: hypothetical protein HOQ36_25635 [Nocardia sp.]|nr:hypothetical protein [Nocardia sp.]